MQSHKCVTDSSDARTPAITRGRLKLTLLIFILALQVMGGQPRADFEDVSESVGLEDNDQKKAFGNSTWVDFDKDGLLDMVSSRHRYDMNVYHNNGDGTFTNLFEESGLYPETDVNWDHHGFAWADYNNDGHWDLFVAEGGSGGAQKNDSQLWFGDGTGKFINKTDESGLTGTGRTVLTADINNDGLTDILKVDPAVALFLRII